MILSKLFPKSSFVPACAATLLLSAGSSLAEVRLHALFTDHAVLQQGREIPVWGWADDGEKVIVEFRDQQVETVADDGRWMVRLDAETAGGPDVLVVRGNNVLVVKDVLVGEVWLASGQSNMQWAMRQTYQPESAIENSENPNLRLFYVPRVQSDEPTENVDAAWTHSNPETTPGFSAVAYYFGRSLQESLGVPVGLVHTSWGGSPAEVWMSREALSGNADYKRDILDDYDTKRAEFETRLQDWEKRRDAAKAAGNEFDERRPNGPYWKPTALYNAMIAPLVPYAVQGAIWYQGESNAGRAFQYRSLFPDMIRNWRDDWQQGQFPFLFVQLAPWDKNRRRPVEEIVATPVDSDWAELREAQLLTTKVLDNAGMAVITDLGDKDDIHPMKKEDVGNRLAIAARGIAYGENLVYSGPVYSGMQLDGDKVVLNFEHVGSGLVAQGGNLTGFSIAGEDRKFVWANAEIRGNQVVVSRDSVERPIAVRYGWSDYPVVNLYNKEGLPATPFRTDNFQMVTER